MAEKISLKNIRKGVLIIGGFIILFTSYKLSQSIAGSKPPQRKEAKSIVKEIYSLKVNNGSYQVQIPSNGVLRAFRRVVLTSRVQGVMQTINPLFKAGQEYKAGQSLVQVDASDYQANVIAQRASLYNLITSVLPDLQLDFPKAYNKWSLFLEGFDVTRTVPLLPEMEDNIRLFVSGRGIISSYYVLQNLEQNLKFYKIQAPFNGVLVSANSTEGSLIRPGQELGEFIAPGNYELMVALPKSYVQKIKVGAKVSLKSIDTNQNYLGIISRINAKVNTQTQSVEVYIQVKNTDLKEGMFLEASIDAQVFEDVFAIDRGLLNGDQQLYIVINNKLQLKKVEAIHFTDALAIIRGLEDDQEILAQPIIGGYEGMEVLSTILNTSN
jgi:multidrug efflux pump subunit AcrA (membrane-fusion protein)